MIVYEIRPSENHLGEVTAGHLVKVTMTPTLSVAGAYAANDYVGPTTTPTSASGFARVNGGSGSIRSVIVHDKAAQSIIGDIWLFNATFTAPTDNAAWSVTDTENLTCVGVIPVAAQLYLSSALNSVAAVPDVNLDYVCAAASTTLYMAFVTRGAPTYASGDLVFDFLIRQD